MAKFVKWAVVVAFWVIITAIVCACPPFGLVVIAFYVWQLAQK